LKKIIGLALAGLLILGMAGYSTFAYFSDTETSTNNIFTAGTLDLKTNNADSVTATWGNGSNPVAPGYSSSGTVTLKNSGTIAANHVDIKFTVGTTSNAGTYNATDLGDADITDMSTVMTVTALSYGGNDLLQTSGIETLDAGTGGVLTLSELNNYKIANLTAPGTNGSTPQDFAMTIGIPTSVGNGIQGDAVNLTVTFGLFQDASQTLP
jgi:predicted ribosomally synthesized peptide with SipW-like signal peptide